MGSHREPQLIVARAMELRLADPVRTALSILDEVMPLRDGYIDLEWESTDPTNTDHVHPAYDNECLPPAPFAEMLRQAFAPDLDPREMLLIQVDGAEDYALEQRSVDALNTWEQRVIAPFYGRYGIPWSWGPSVNIVDRPSGYVEELLSRERWLSRFAGHQMTWGKVDIASARALAEAQFRDHAKDDPDAISLALLDPLHRSIYDSYHVAGRVDYWSWISRFQTEYAMATGITAAAANPVAIQAWAQHCTVMPEDAATAVAVAT